MRITLGPSFVSVKIMILLFPNHPQDLLYIKKKRGGVGTNQNIKQNQVHFSKKQGTVTKRNSKYPSNLKNTYSGIGSSIGPTPKLGEQKANLELAAKTLIQNPSN